MLENANSKDVTGADSICPGCGSKKVSIFYEVKNVPVHSCVLMPTAGEALNFLQRDISLGFCDDCAFIYNVAFDPSVQDYGMQYEDQQCFSPTFNAFADDLVNSLIEKHDLRNKDVVEIGCGKGDFLLLLCEKGNNRGVGIDPACEPDRIKSGSAGNVKFIRDYYSEKYGHHRGDFVCCRHTLEHIHRTSDFVGIIRRAIGNRLDTIVFFEVPDTVRVLRDRAFWDIYYEHCSYFSPGSLARLFRICGFEVTDIAREFDDQYLLLEAKPVDRQSDNKHELEETIQQLKGERDQFSTSCKNRLDNWKRKLQRFKNEGKRVAIWGSGSKCVAFLTTLRIKDEVEYVVDINPHRHGLFIPGAAKEIKSPDSLKEYKPDIVIVMNAIYMKEIREMLAAMGQSPELTTV